MNKKIWLLLSIFFLLVVSLVILSPILRPGMLVTDDGNWMVIRLSAFYQSFREGQFPVRFLGRLNQSYGYPVANFLYPGFMYIGSMLHVLGLSFQTSVEAILVGSVMIGVIGMFLWLRLSFSNIASVTGALSYLLMPYLLFDIFKRGSVGEVLALGLMPLVLYVIESKNTWLLAPVIALLAISHNTLAAFFIPLALAYIVLKKYWHLIPQFIFGVGMSSFFWLPAFFERVFVNFDTTVISNPGAYFTMSNSLILASFPFFIAALYVAFKRPMRQKKETIFFLASLAISVYFATRGSAFFWRVADFVKFIQFPFRWLSYMVIAGPWIIGAAINKTKKGALVAGCCLVIFLTAVWGTQYIQSESVIHPEGYFTTNEATTTVHDEYMPRWAAKHMSTRGTKKVEFFMGNGTIEEKIISTQKIDVVIHATEKSIMQINTIYYPGWGAMLDDAPVKILSDNPYGFMRIMVPEGKHHLYMEFRETPGRFLADVVSVVFGLLYVISCVVFFFTNTSASRKRTKKK
ncbi:MAG: hypothetical protein WAV51_03065 [Microgenomates group bacterium]